MRASTRPEPGAAPVTPKPRTGKPWRTALAGLLLLGTAGVATLRTESSETVKLLRGESCFIPAADGPLYAAGPARLFLASPGQ